MKFKLNSFFPDLSGNTSEATDLGIDFILKHFPDPIFPRSISTYKSHGKQFEVFSKGEMLKAYEESDFKDCRVNAYPSFTEYKGIQRYPPNFIFADLDQSTFKSQRSLDRALTSILGIIKTKISATPTVLWSGNGYHIYQPIDAFILEEYEEFFKFGSPSQRFLRFAESYLTNGKSDPSHNPSFKSCMIRIPGSYNSKYREDNVVRIIQKWNGFRPPIKLLFGSFHPYLVDEKIKQDKLQKRLIRWFGPNFSQGKNKIAWIETFLQIPIEDYRKNSIDLILAPYLVNIKKITYSQSELIIKDWLNKCDTLKKLDSNFGDRIKYSLNTAIRKHTLPMRFVTLKEKNNILYNLIKEKMQMKGLIDSRSE
jgi:hypothetical protein